MGKLLKVIKNVYEPSEIMFNDVRIPVLKLIDSKKVNIKDIRIMKEATHELLEKLKNQLLKEAIESEKEGIYVEYVLKNEEKKIEVRVGRGFGAKGELAKWPTKLIRLAIFKEPPRGELKLDDIEWFEVDDNIYLFEGTPRGNCSAILFMTEDGAYLYLPEKTLESDITEIKEEEEGTEESDEE